jgi:hypothetical protein
MINLAGKTKADLYILEELSVAGIEVVEGKRTRSEVPYTITGKLADWNFSRAWYYWMANADKGLPLEVATELHSRKYPVEGERQPETYGQVIRVDGGRGYPAPTRSVRSYHIDSQEGLNALADAIRALHNMATSGTDSKEMLRLYDKISALYTEWETEAKKDGVEWLKKMPTIFYGNGRPVNELIVAIQDEQEVVSIAKKWQDNGHGGIAQYFFKDGQITGFNYGNFSGPGQILNRGPEVDGMLRPHYEEIKQLRPKSAESLELCMQALERPGPEYTGRSDGGMTVQLARRVFV